MHPGLCASCRHAELVKGARSAFWMCGRARTDPAYPRYPRLPVLACAGHELVTEPPSKESGSRSD